MPDITITECKQMLCGKPQVLSSKFKLSFALTLSLVKEKKSVVNFAKQTLLTQDVLRDLRQTDENIASLEKKLSEPHSYQCDEITVKDYWSSINELVMSSNKRKKTLHKVIHTFESEYTSIKNDYEKYNERHNTEKCLRGARVYRENTERYIENTVKRTTELLIFRGFMDTSQHITPMGYVASQFQDVHPLAFTDIMYESKNFKEFDSIELTGFLAICVSVTTPEIHTPSTSSDLVNTTSRRLRDLMNEYYDLEQRYSILSGSNYEVSFDLQSYVLDWCYAEDEVTCREILLNLPIFLGDFIKCLLKINHIAVEVERAAELANQLDLVAKLKEIPKHTLKFIATNSSLYI
jgi:hypothetical protein